MELLTKTDKYKAIMALLLREVYKLDDLLNGSIYLERRGRLAKRIDFAWSVYQNDKVPAAYRKSAFDFLIYAFDIQDTNDVDKKLARLMEEKLAHPKEDYDYIPGKFIKNQFPPEELLHVNELSKEIDKDKNTLYLLSIERAEHRVHIHNGLFKKDGNVFDTSEMISHNKPGYAAFTLTAPYGELSVFSHKTIAKGRIAHSSMNAGRPVLAAGEIKIEKGVITAITTHSGHYKPSLLSLYRTLEYFAQNRVPISNIKVLTLSDPGIQLPGTKSEQWNSPNGIYFVTPVEMIYKNIKRLLDSNIELIDEEVTAYKNSNALNQLFMIKDWIMGTHLTQQRIELAREFATELNAYKISLSENIFNNSELIVKIDELKALIEKYQLKNDLLSDNYKKEAGSGRLGNKLTLFGQSLDMVKSKSQEQEVDYLKAIH